MVTMVYLRPILKGKSFRYLVAPAATKEMGESRGSFYAKTGVKRRRRRTEKV